MKGITKHGDKYRIRWTDHLGSRQSAVFNTKKEAKIQLLKRKQETLEIKNGTRRLFEDPGFEDLAQKYLENVSRFKKSDHHDKSIIGSGLLPHLKKTRLVDIPSKIPDYYKLKSHLSPKTLFNHITMLNAMLNFAYEQGYLRKPIRIKRPKVDFIDKNYKYLKNEKEIQLFLKGARQQGQHLYYLYKTALFTGMRAGELAGLKWSDIDFTNRIITVSKSYDTSTKNGETRHIPILDELVEDLKEMERTRVDEQVFLSRTGSPLQPCARAFQEDLKQSLRHSGLHSPITFHDLRHTFASHWMMKGGSLFKLQRILGHKSISMTQRYSHLSPHAFENDWDRMNFTAN